MPDLPKWFLVSNGFHPQASSYFSPTTLERPIFQGDIFRGAFGAFWPHPAVKNFQLQDQQVPDVLPYPDLAAVNKQVQIRGEGYAMILPQPCEYSEGEKGDTHPYRVVAPVLPLNHQAGLDQNKVRSGEIGHVFWVPNWKAGKIKDYYVDLRWTAAIDKAFVSRQMRVAALSPAAWLSLVDRLSRYFVGIAVATDNFALEQALLHPDYS